MNTTEINAEVAESAEPIKAPFPWFGGKRRAAHLVWPRLGNVPNYSEPFAGSLAVLLNRPHAPGNEIVNDLDCYVANAWRAVQHAPAEVAAHCDWPVNEADLHARHRWLHGRKEFRLAMENAPEHFDAKIAAWWIWGLSCWIGDAFCRVRCESSPHLGPGSKGVAKDVSGSKGVIRQLPRITGAYGQTTERKRPSLAAWKCVDKRRPHIGNENGSNTKQGAALLEWFEALAARLRFTKVCCGDWARVSTKAATYGQGLTGVLLDPPYARELRDENIYSHEADGLSDQVRAWAIENGENPLMRIALCGYEGEHAMPANWACVPWKANGGYANRNAENVNAHKERIWFSPHCLHPEGEFNFSDQP